MTPSSSSLRSTLILLCLIAAFFTSPSTSNPLSDVCAKSKNPGLCLKVLEGNSHQNPHDLTETAINLAAANASATAAKINMLFNQTNDQKLEEIYNLCTTYYSAVIRTLGNAEQFLNMGQYQNLNTAANLVGQDAFNCETAFEVTPGIVSTITKENDDLQFLGSIIVAAAGFLTGSSS
ncbi:pectinesterase inhibitor-like [Nicotiana sylvestris]|uniref:Pectinesterase inhibitor-like n=1 Tax=Nicotiana sylvestris TaxID=4096 RepID=A0A1U7WIG1_NICSY|nr:PREDICTED: pectinesterase inhibitor-like [Nicotiana sylvestris]